MCLATTAVAGHGFARLYLAASCTLEPACVETVKYGVISGGVKSICDFLPANSQPFFSGIGNWLGLVDLAGIMLIEFAEIAEFFALLLL